jgi:hypothetical protein
MLPASPTNRLRASASVRFPGRRDATENIGCHRIAAQFTYRKKNEHPFEEVQKTGSAGGS